MKYLGETLTNDLKISQHLKDKKTNIQSILNLCIYTTKNEMLSQIKPKTFINKAIPNNNATSVLIQM